MALYLRGNVWWMEYRTRKVRKVMSTGLKKEEREAAKAAYAALRLAMTTKARRSAVEGILDAIYGTMKDVSGIPLDGVWSIYEDWCKGKGRKLSHDTFVNRRNLCVRFVEWAKGRGAYDITDVSVNSAREYVKELARIGKSNKTQRTYCGYLSTIWGGRPVEGGNTQSVEGGVSG